MVATRRGGLKPCSILLALNFDDRELFQQLTRAYTPDADAFCGGLIQKLELAVERHTSDLCESHSMHLFLLPLSSF